MNIPLAKLLSLPFIGVIIWFFLKSNQDYTREAVWMLIVPLIILSVMYVFHHQINTWWWKKRPPALPKKLVSLLAHLKPEISMWPQHEALKFMDRLSVFIHTKTFVLKRERDYDVEEDMKALMAYEFIRTSMDEADFLLEHYDQFILYDHPFGTPDKYYLHCMEIQQEDGVIIMSREQMLNGLLSPAEHFNIALWAALQANRKNLSPRSVDTLVPIDAHLLELLGIDEEKFRLYTGEDHVVEEDVLLYAHYIDVVQPYPEKKIL